MKTYKNILIAAMVISIAAFNSCKKEASTEDATKDGRLMLHLHTDVDSNEVEGYGEEYNLDDGRKISVSLAQMYISGIQAVKLDGSLISIPDVVVLKTKEVEQYLIGNIPPGNYKSVKFNIGLDPVTNQNTLSSKDSTINSPTMWFGSTAQPGGYVFINFQGMIDTSVAMTGGPNAGFSYRIGTDANMRNVQLPDKNFTVAPDQTYEVHIAVNYAALLKGVDLTVSGNLHINSVADNATPLAVKVVNNITDMFSYEE